MLNISRTSLHPEGLAARTLNFPEWGAYLVDKLHRLAVDKASEELVALEREILGYPNVRTLLESLAGGRVSQAAHPLFVARTLYDLLSPSAP